MNGSAWRGALTSREEETAPLLSSCVSKDNTDILPSYGDMLTTKEVSDAFQISITNLRQMCRENQIPCCRIGSQYRFPKAWLCEWARGGDNG